MFEDPSFFVALSFLGFCAVVYLWQGKVLKSFLLDAIQARLDPIYKAEQNFHALADIWLHAKHRMENVSKDVQDIHQHYESVLKQSLESGRKREKQWLQARQGDMAAFQLFQQQQANKKALQTVLNEFIDESTKPI